MGKQPTNQPDEPLLITSGSNTFQPPPEDDVRTWVRQVEPEHSLLEFIEFIVSAVPFPPRVSVERVGVERPVE
jgi:hypothetical protein